MPASTVLVEVSRTAEVLARLNDDAVGWLTESEQQRLAGLRVAARRDHYLAGHWLVRELLSQAFGETPKHWPLLERRSQPPQVLGGDGRLRVSISHSGDWIAAAIADAAIGIDIEQRPRPLDAAIESLLLNAGEAPGSVSQDDLLQRWVAKEAWIKSRAGSALPTQLKQLELRAVAPKHADVCIHSHDALHLALACDSGCAVVWRGSVALQAGLAWSVSAEPVATT